jgi:hypothetical protein
LKIFKNQLPVVASLKNSDIIASIPKHRFVFVFVFRKNSLPINANMTVNKGAAGNTIDALCSIIRKRSTKKSNDFLGKNFQSEKLTNKKKYLKMGITKKH